MTEIIHQGTPATLKTPVIHQPTIWIGALHCCKAQQILPPIIHKLPAPNNPVHLINPHHQATTLEETPTTTTTQLFHQT
jgi:hypothetical protein